MGVALERQGEGVGSQLLANALQIIYHEHGSADLMIRIDVDPENVDARNAYLHWGFEPYRRFVSGASEYEMMLLRPANEEESEPEPAPGA